MRKAIQLPFILLLAAAGGAYGQSFQNYTGDFPPTVEALYHVPVEMRDGVRLMTDVYLPEADGRFPTLLVRDMYSQRLQRPAPALRQIRHRQRLRLCVPDGARTL